MASIDFGTLRRYRGLWVWLESGTRGLVRIRSGRFGDTVRWVCVVYAGWFGPGCRRSGRDGDTIRLGRSVPGGWVGHFALVKCYTCLRGASGVRLLTFGQRWSEQVGGGSGSDLVGWGPTRAHKKGVGHRRGPSCDSSHSEQRHTNAGENHGVVYLHGRSCSLFEERCHIIVVPWALWFLYARRGRKHAARFSSTVALVSVALHSRAIVSPWLALCLLSRVGLAGGIESP